MAGLVSKAKKLVNDFFTAEDCESCHKLRRALCLTACATMKPVHDRWDKKQELKYHKDLLKEEANDNEKARI